MPSHSNNKGVTLMELMIVVVIVSIIAVFTVPSFAGLLAKSRVSSTADQLYSDLQFAKAESLRRSTQIAVIQQDGGWEKGWCVATGFKNGQTCKDIAESNILLNKVGPEATVTVLNLCFRQRTVSQLIFWNGYAFEQNNIFDRNPVNANDRAQIPGQIAPQYFGFQVQSGLSASFAMRRLVVEPSTLLNGNPPATIPTRCPPV